MKPRGLCITTKCKNVDEFIAKFHPHCDETSLFVSVVGTREVGSESPFAILLADRTPVLRGWCVVFDSWTDAANPFGRPGIRVGLHRLTSQSATVFARLQAARVAAAASGTPLVSAPRTPTLPLPRATPSRPLTVQIPALTSRRPTTEQAALQAIPMRVPERMATPSSGLAQQVSVPAFGLAIPTPEVLLVSTPVTAARAKLADSSASFAKLAPVALADSSSSFTKPTLERSARPSRAPIAILAEGSTETRTPGSKIVLPANPMSEITDESIDGFVECLLIDPTAPVSLRARIMTAVEPEPDAEPDTAIIVDTLARPIRVTGELTPLPPTNHALPAVVVPSPALQSTQSLWADRRFVAALILAAMVLAFLISFGVA